MDTNIIDSGRTDTSVARLTVSILIGIYRPNLFLFLTRIPAIIQIMAEQEHWKRVMNRGAFKLIFLADKSSLLRNTMEIDTTQYTDTTINISTYFDMSDPRSLLMLVCLVISFHFMSLLGM